MKTPKNNNATRRAINKRLLTLMVAMLLAAPAMAQIFLDDESLTNIGWMQDIDEMGNIVPFHEMEMVRGQSEYTPTGSGILLLTVLGGAYLIGKRRKED